MWATNFIKDFSQKYLIWHELQAVKNMCMLYIGWFILNGIVSEMIYESKQEIDFLLNMTSNGWDIKSANFHHRIPKQQLKTREQV